MKSWKATIEESHVENELNARNVKSDEEARRPYAAPEVLRVNLRPEEAVLSACKTAAAPGPIGSACATPLGGCQTAGS